MKKYFLFSVLLLSAVCLAGCLSKQVDETKEALNAKVGIVTNKAEDAANKIKEETNNKIEDTTNTIKNEVNNKIEDATNKAQDAANELKNEITNKEVGEKRNLGIDCEAEDNEEEIKWFCIRLKAADSGNVELCDSIDDSHEKQFCIKEVAIKKLDIELCKTLNNNPYSLRDECIKNVAIKTNNPELCKLIEDVGGGFYKNGCAFDIAVQRKDKSICQLAGTPEICLIRYAIQFSDLSICNTVNDKIGCTTSITCPDEKNETNCAAKQGCKWREDIVSCCPQKGYVCNFTFD